MIPAQMNGSRLAGTPGSGVISSQRRASAEQNDIKKVKEEQILIGQAVPLQGGSRTGIANARRSSGGGAGEEEWIMVGPAVALGEEPRDGISNLRQSPNPRVRYAELLLELAKLLNWYCTEMLAREGASTAKGDSRHSLANAGYNPNEPRIPAGQHGSGQWTSSGGGTGAVAPRGVSGPKHVSRFIAQKAAPTPVPTAQKGQVTTLLAKPSLAMPVPVAKGGQVKPLAAPAQGQSGAGDGLQKAPSTPTVSGGNPQTSQGPQASPTDNGNAKNPAAAKGQSSGGGGDSGNPKTVGQAAKETAEAFLSSLLGTLRSILYPSEPDPEPSKPKNIVQLAQELDEAADNIDMTKPKGLGHAMAAGAIIAAGEAAAEGAAGSAPKPRPSGLDAISEARARVQASGNTYGNVDAKNMAKSPAGNTAGTGALQKGEVTTYGNADARAVVGDKLSAHEIWQHANLNEVGLAGTRLSTPASQKNPVIILDADTHAAVNAAQEAANPRAMTPVENITRNAQILRQLGAAPPEAIDAAEKAALDHARNYGY